MAMFNIEHYVYFTSSISPFTRFYLLLHVIIYNYIATR